MEKDLTNNDFYNYLASEYDEMISFEKSIENKKKLFAKFVTDKIKSAVDIGCGSGADSIALASLGVKVTAFDPSQAMIKFAKANANKLNVGVELFLHSADEIPEPFNSKFDLAVSLGNTFANIPTKKLENSLKRIFDVLKPNGILLMQVLNYKKIVSEQKRIVNINEGEDKYFIRFYNFLDDQIYFNILIFRKSNPADRSLITTKIYPHNKEDFSEALMVSGFNSIRFSSDFAYSEFIDESSKDLVIISKKK